MSACHPKTSRNISRAIHRHVQKKKMNTPKERCGHLKCRQTEYREVLSGFTRPFKTKAGTLELGDRFHRNRPQTVAAFFTVQEGYHF